MTYAAQTQVPISRTKTDIEELLAKHGAAGFAYATEGDCSLRRDTHIFGGLGVILTPRLSRLCWNGRP